MKLKSDFGVRALFGTMVIGGAVVASFVMILKGQPEAGMAFLSSAGLAALGFYFGQKTQ